MRRQETLTKSLLDVGDSSSTEQDRDDSPKPARELVDRSEEVERETASKETLHERAGRKERISSSVGQERERSRRKELTSRTVTITSVGQSTLVQMTFESDSKRFVEASFSLEAASWKSKASRAVSSEGKRMVETDRGARRRT